MIVADELYPALQSPGLRSYISQYFNNLYIQRVKIRKAACYNEIREGAPRATGACRMNRTIKILMIAVANTALAAVGFSQVPNPIRWQDKLRFHAATAYGADALAASAVYDGFLQTIDSPREWGRGGAGYGKRLGSTLAYSGIRNTLGFGLDTALHQDPRYYRSGDTGLWRRLGHAVRGTILTHTDSGGETLATWRLGSAYSAAFLSNEWYPDRLNTVKLGLVQGSAQIGFDLLANLRSEFWPDIKKKLLHHKP
jgi:hypothetical protein